VGKTENLVQSLTTYLTICERTSITLAYVPYTLKNKKLGINRYRHLQWGRQYVVKTLFSHYVGKKSFKWNYKNVWILNQIQTSLTTILKFVKKLTNLLKQWNFILFYWKHGVEHTYIVCYIFILFCWTYCSIVVYLQVYNPLFSSWGDWISKNLFFADVFVIIAIGKSQPDSSRGVFSYALIAQSISWSCYLFVFIDNRFVYYLCNGEIWSLPKNQI